MSDEQDVNNPGAGAPDPAVAQAAEEKVVNAGDVPEDDAEAAMLAMLSDLPEQGSKATLDDINFGSAPVARAEFQGQRHGSR